MGNGSEDVCKVIFSPGHFGYGRRRLIPEAQFASVVLFFGKQGRVYPKKEEIICGLFDK
jgi:hypothetical protein